VIAFFLGVVYGLLAGACGVLYFVVRTMRARLPESSGRLDEPAMPIGVHPELNPVDEAAIVAELEVVDRHIEHEYRLERLARLDRALHPYGLRSAAGRCLQ
jgi:hypothetical protein